MAEKLTLSGVPETMLQTIYARAKESRGRGAIHDAKAEEIIDRLDYDFSLADWTAAMFVRNAGSVSCPLNLPAAPFAENLRKAPSSRPGYAPAVRKRLRPLREPAPHT